MEQKILLIDDSAILRRIATNVLGARAGCGEVITATRATEGFARACGSAVSLALIDFGLAGSPDARLCRRLLDEPRTSHVPVILLLAPGTQKPNLAALPGNVVDFLVKPFTPEELLSAVKNVLEAIKTDAPVPRLREQAFRMHGKPASVPSDHHEVSAAVTVAALARRETNRVQHARTSQRGTSVPSATAAASRRSSELTRLRAELHASAARLETGVFRIRAGEEPPTEIYLESGHIVLVTTRDAERYSVGTEGVLPPKVSLAMLEDSVAEQTRSGVPFFLTLGSRGLLSKTMAVTLLYRFGQQHLARLWKVPADQLSFEFTVLDALPGFALRLEPRRESVDEWLLGTLRLLEPQDLADLARHEGFAGTPTFRKGGAASSRALRLTEREVEFGRQVDDRRNLLTVAKNLGVPVEQAFLLLFQFRCLEIMDYRPTASAFVVTPRTSVRRVLPLQR